MRWISLGGGAQSSALIVLAVEGKLGPVDGAVFANVGDDSEDPRSLVWIRDVLAPYCENVGFPLVERQRVRRNGEVETLRGRLNRGLRSIDIPVRMAPTGAPGNRKCTHDFKIAVVDKFLKEQGATKDDPATVLIGFSTDEVERLNNKRWSAVSVAEHPLIFDLHLDRSACQELNRRTFGAPAPKSSCYFCPFRSDFAEMKRDDPELFEQAAQVEDECNETRVRIGKDPVFLHRFCRPLRELTQAQDALFGSDGQCNEACFT